MHLTLACGPLYEIRELYLSRLCHQSEHTQLKYIPALLYRTAVYTMKFRFL